MTDENNQIKFFLYENWARTKTGQHTVFITLNYCHFYNKIVTCSASSNNNSLSLENTIPCPTMSACVVCVCSLTVVV